MLQTSLFDIFGLTATEEPKQTKPQLPKLINSPTGNRLLPFAGFANKVTVTPTSPNSGIVEFHHKAIQKAINSLPPSVDHRIHFGREVLVHGEIGKIKANLEALKLLQILKSTGRAATHEEQAKLACWCSWGPVARLFNEPTPKPLVPHLAELKELLPDHLMESLIRSSQRTVVNAFYTCPDIAKSIWEGIQVLGFQTGVIVEPSVGAGVFLGTMPESIRTSSEIHATELDTLTADIAKHLYPSSKIKCRPFEDLLLPDNSVDLFISNVPFLNITVVDPHDAELRGLGANLHDYFFAKAIKALRPGGLCAFITSAGTLDKKNKTIRQWLSNRASFIGALRLPNNSFKENANTSVVTDLVILQKRHQAVESEDTWINSEGWEDEPTNPWVSSYYKEYPQNLLGVPGLKPWGNTENKDRRIDWILEPKEGLNLQAAILDTIKSWLPNINKTSLCLRPADRGTIQDPKVKVYDGPLPDWSFIYEEGQFWVHKNHELHPFPIEVPASKTKALEDALIVRDCLWTLLKLQASTTSSNEQIESVRTELNRLYERFIMRYGAINDRKLVNLLRKDLGTGHYLLSLEIWNSETKVASKADIFTRRTQVPTSAPVKAETAKESLCISLGIKGKVDLSYMAQLTGKSALELIADLGDLLFRDPLTEEWNTSEVYLTGPTRAKLTIAQRMAAQHPEFQRNVDALIKNQPEEIGPDRINVSLGAPWIPADLYRDFLNDVIKGSWTVIYYRSTECFSLDAKYPNSAWSITSARVNRSSIWLVEAIFRGGAIKVEFYDEILEKRVLAIEETTLANLKADELRDLFQTWIWNSQKWGHKVIEIYNNLFNDWVYPKYDGSHLLQQIEYDGKTLQILPGQNPSIELRPHQIDCAWRIVSEPATLAHHDVGTGKTYTAIAAAMEAKRLGIVNKPLVVAPNHVFTQYAGDWAKLFPSAHLLIVDPSELHHSTRPSTMAKIATGDWDGVLVAQSSFTKIPMSPGFQQNFFDNIISNIQEEIGEDKNAKELQKAIKTIQARLTRLEAKWNKDKGPFFDDLGVDMLIVDEAHEWKNLFIASQMREAGINTAHDVQRSWDLFMKIHYLKQNKQSKVVFTTGTPVSNSMTELYIMMKYLMPNYLESIGMGQFDSWAKTYGVICPDLEATVDGSGARMKSRFRKFVNVATLQRMWSRISDRIALKNTSIKIPKIIGDGKPARIVLERSEFQSEYIDDLKNRIERVQSGQVDKTKDNMLKIVTEGRKLALDPRLILPILPDDPNSKINNAISNTVLVYEETMKLKGTQIIWCDLGTPARKTKAPISEPSEQKASESEVSDSIEDAEEHIIDMDAEDEFEEGAHGGLNLYEDIRNKLLARGIPEEEIAFIHQAKTREQRATLFQAMRDGKIRIMIASTGKLSTGANIQTRLAACHHLHPTWKPAEIEQRNGRILRQGNLWADFEGVRIYIYVTKGTFDSYMWQILQNKQTFLDQFFNCGEIDTMDNIDFAADQYAEIKAAAAMDPRIGEIVKLQHSIKSLEQEKKAKQAESFTLTHRRDDLQRRLKLDSEKLEEIDNIYSRITDLELNDLEIFGERFQSHKDAGNAILQKINLRGLNMARIGKIRGIGFTLKSNAANREKDQGLMWTMSIDAIPNEYFRFDANTPSTITQGILRIESDLARSVYQMKGNMDYNKRNFENIETSLKTQSGFTKQEELETFKVRLAELEKELAQENSGNNKILGIEDLQPSKLAALTIAVFPKLTTNSLLLNNINRCQLLNAEYQKDPNFLEAMELIATDYLPKIEKQFSKITHPKDSKGKQLANLVSLIQQEAILNSALKIRELPKIAMNYLENCSVIMQIEQIHNQTPVIPNEIPFPLITAYTKSDWELLLETHANEYTPQYGRYYVSLRLLNMGESVPDTLTKENASELNGKLLRWKYRTIKAAA